MGISLRLYIVNDDDSLQRIPVAKYERLLDRDPRGRLPQYARKRMRYALVFVDLEKRQPVEILRIQCSYLYFDSARSRYGWNPCRVKDYRPRRGGG